MIINRKTDRVVVEFGEGNSKVTAFFSPLTVATKASLSSRLLPFVKFAGKNTDDITKGFYDAEGNLALDTEEKKAQFQEFMSASSEIQVFTKGIIKETLREVSGLFDNDGNEYKLEFDALGKPTEDCLDELLACDELASGVVRVSQMFLHGVPAEGKVLDPQSGNPIPGIIVKKSLKGKTIA